MHYTKTKSPFEVEGDLDAKIPFCEGDKSTGYPVVPFPCPRRFLERRGGRYPGSPTQGAILSAPAFRCTQSGITVAGQRRTLTGLPLL